eukprot:g280.t1
MEFSAASQSRLNELLDSMSTEQHFGPIKLVKNRGDIVHETLAKLGFNLSTIHPSTQPPPSRPFLVKLPMTRADISTADSIVRLEDARPETEVRELVGKSHEAQKVWSQLKGFKRMEILHAIFQEIMGFVSPLTMILSIEVGMTIHEAKEEIMRMVDIIEMVNKLADDTGGTMPYRSEHYDFRYGEKLHGWTREVRHIPLGVMGKITPFDSPFTSFALGVFPALAAGCTCIVKPHMDATLATFALVRIINRAVISFQKRLQKQEKGHSVESLMLHRSLEYIVGAFAQEDWHMIEMVLKDDRVSVWEATGGCRMGEMMRWYMGKRFKRLYLATGTNNCAIVNGDCDLEASGAVEKIALCATKGAGQRWTNTRLVYVHRSLFDKFRDRLIKFYQTKLHVGDPLDFKTNVGPVRHDAGLNAFENGVKDFQKDGSTLLCGGDLIFGNFVQPTVMEAPRINYKAVLDNDLQAPILHIAPFGERNALGSRAAEQSSGRMPKAPNDLAEIIAAINGSQFGFSCSVFTENKDFFLQCAEKIKCGQVNMNRSNDAFDISSYYGGEGKTGIDRVRFQDLMQRYTRPVKTLLPCSVEGEMS